MIEISSKNEKLYVEMCEKAKQLQSRWKPKIGDSCIYMENLLIINDEKSLNNVKSIKGNNIPTYLTDSPLIWILSEEDIEEILFAPTMENPEDLLFRFAEWVNGHRGITDAHRKFPIKHLWLCYLMYHLYGLTWIENWKKIDYERKN